MEVWESLCREGKGHRYRLYRIKMTFLPQQYYSVSPIGNIVFRYHGNFPCISVKQCVRIFTYVACAERLRNKSTVDFQLEIKELFDVDHSFLCHNIAHVLVMVCCLCQLLGGVCGDCKPGLGLRREDLCQETGVSHQQGDQDY